MSHLPQPIILVIDSEAVSLTATSAVLHCQNYQVHCAQDRDAALKAARQLDLDLVICDLNLDGEEDGVRLVEQIRQIPGRNEVPIMFASSGQLPDVIRRNHQTGAAYHLKKPFDHQVLIELVRRALWMPHLVSGHIANTKIRQPHFDVGSLPLSAPSAPSWT